MKLKIFTILALFFGLGFSQANAVETITFENPTYNDYMYLQNLLDNGNYGNLNDVNLLVRNSIFAIRSYCNFMGGGYVSHTSESSYTYDENNNVVIWDVNQFVNSSFSQAVDTKRVTSITCEIYSENDLFNADDLADLIKGFILHEDFKQIVVLYLINIMNIFFLFIVAKTGFKTGYLFFYNNIGKKFGN